MELFSINRIADLAGVQDQVGIEDLLDTEHQIDGCVATLKYLSTRFLNSSSSRSLLHW